MVKTTIDMPDALWKNFSIRVIEQHGGRKKNDVIIDLINQYLEKTDESKEKGGKNVRQRTR